MQKRQEGRKKVRGGGVGLSCIETLKINYTADPFPMLHQAREGELRRAEALLAEQQLEAARATADAKEVQPLPFCTSP